LIGQGLSLDWALLCPALYAKFLAETVHDTRSAGIHEDEILCSERGHAMQMSCGDAKAGKTMLAASCASIGGTYTTPWYVRTVVYACAWCCVAKQAAQTAGVDW
jgi:hypothetical protein